MPRLDYLAITDYIEEKLLAYKHVPTIDDLFGSEEEFYEATKEWLGDSEFDDS